jgi:hypothetical protein
MFMKISQSVAVGRAPIVGNCLTLNPVREDVARQLQGSG